MFRGRTYLLNLVAPSTLSVGGSIWAPFVLGTTKKYHKIDDLELQTYQIELGLELWTAEDALDNTVPSHCNQRLLFWR